MIIDPEKTRWAIKIRNRRAYELSALALLLFGIAALLGLVAALQVGLCRHERPGTAIIDCLKPEGERP